MKTVPPDISQEEKDPPEINKYVLDERTRISGSSNSSPRYAQVSAAMDEDPQVCLARLWAPPQSQLYRCVYAVPRFL